MRRTTVKDIMSKDVVTARPSAPFKELARMFREHKVGAIPIVDEGNHVVGIVSETDLVERTAGVQLSDRPWTRRLRLSARSRQVPGPESTAAALMSEPAVTIWPDANLAECARLMSRREVTHLPVVDESSLLLGIVGRSDVLGVFLAGDDHIRHVVEYEVIERTMWLDPDTVTVHVKDGVVTLAGQLERKSMVPITVELTSLVDGVVGVIDHLTYEKDDSQFSALPPRSAFPH